MLRRPALLAASAAGCRRTLATKTIPSASYDAIVVGGGVVGSSTAYQLQKQGLRTLLLESHALTAGTTWHTAGMLWRLRPSYVDIELHTRTRQLAMELEAEKGAAWTENGGLFIACDKERLAEYERLAQTGDKYGIESYVLSPTEAKRVHPLLNVSDIYGALHSPTDGTLGPRRPDHRLCSRRQGPRRHRPRGRPCRIRADRNLCRCRWRERQACHWAHDDLRPECRGVSRGQRVRLMGG